MARTRSCRARWVGWVAVVVCLAIPGALFGQATPKLPTPLPVPKTAPPKAEPAKPARAKTPEPAKTEAAPAAGERDPFEPLVQKTAPGEGEPQQISSLKLVGVLWDPVNRDQIRALVETPDGLGYYVRLNEEKFGAKVVAIERDRVKFSVREQDPSGQVRVRTIELKLR